MHVKFILLNKIKWCLLIAVAAPLLISVCAKPIAISAFGANTPASEGESINN